MKKIIFIFCMCSNIILSFKLYAQEVKVTYEVSAKQVITSNSSTNKVLEAISKRVNTILPRIKFIVQTNKKYNKFYYEKYIATDYENPHLFELAISIVLDGKQIFGDFDNNIAYYEPTLTNKIRSVQLENFKWSIKKESKNLLGFKCFKATGQILDAEAENKLTPPTIAWFCPELSVHGGPTAYATLPGMILELENQKLKFIAKNIEEVRNFELKIPKYKAEDILSHKEWTAYHEANNPLPINKN